MSGNRDKRKNQQEPSHSREMFADKLLQKVFEWQSKSQMEQHSRKNVGGTIHRHGPWRSTRRKPETPGFLSSVPDPEHSKQKWESSKRGALDTKSIAKQNHLWKLGEAWFPTYSHPYSPPYSHTQHLCGWPCWSNFPQVLWQVPEEKTWNKEIFI